MGNNLFPRSQGHQSQSHFLVSLSLRVHSNLICLLDTRLVQVPEKRSQQDTTVNQMIRLHVLMPRSTRELQDRVGAYAQVTGTWNRD